MRIYEFGNRDKPILMLFPGTFCHWKLNFQHVIEPLQKKFFTVCVSYDGFCEAEETKFESILIQTEKIEQYIQEHYNGVIYAAYGCSLGGSLVSHVVSRKKVKIGYAIIGSSDFDQSGKLSAALKTQLFVWMLYPLIHNGKFKNWFIQKAFKKSIENMDNYGRAFLSFMEDMRFVRKESMKNLFYSDLVTPVPENINVTGTEIHILYALKMGKKYIKRYQRHFVNPIIHEQALRHEELLAVYPEEWTDLIIKIGKL